MSEWWFEPTPPETQLVRIASFLFSSIEIERIFEPIIADWHEEYFQAYNAGRILKATLISLYYRYKLAQTMGLKMCFTLMSTVSGIVISRTSKN